MKHHWHNYSESELDDRKIGKDITCLFLSNCFQCCHQRHVSLWQRHSSIKSQGLWFLQILIFSKSRYAWSNAYIFVWHLWFASRWGIISIYMGGKWSESFKIKLMYIFAWYCITSQVPLWNEVSWHMSVRQDALHTFGCGECVSWTVTSSS